MLSYLWLSRMRQEIEPAVKELLLDRDLKRESKIHELKPNPIFLDEEDLQECCI